MLNHLLPVENYYCADWCSLEQPLKTHQVSKTQRNCERKRKKAHLEHMLRGSSSAETAGSVAEQDLFNLFLRVQSEQ